MKYILDLKVYQRVPDKELPMRFPDRVFADGYLRIGYHQVNIECDEQEMDKFMTYAAGQADFKILGSTTL